MDPGVRNKAALKCSVLRSDGVRSPPFVVLPKRFFFAFHFFFPIHTSFPLCLAQFPQWTGLIPPLFRHNAHPTVHAPVVHTQAADSRPDSTPATANNFGTGRGRGTWSCCRWRSRRLSRGAISSPSADSTGMVVITPPTNLYLRCFPCHDPGSGCGTYRNRPGTSCRRWQAMGAGRHCRCNCNLYLQDGIPITDRKGIPHAIRNRRNRCCFHAGRMARVGSDTHPALGLLSLSLSLSLL